MSEIVWMQNMDKIMSEVTQARADADLAAVVKLLGDGEVYLLGDLTTEVFGPNGVTVTRTFMGKDGKLHSGVIDSNEFYA